MSKNPLRLIAALACGVGEFLFFALLFVLFLPFGSALPWPEDADRSVLDL